MCQGQFMHKKSNEAWQFLEDLVERNLQWETTRKPDRSIPLRGEMHQVQRSLAAKVKIATLTYWIEVLELQGHAQVNQASAPICNGYGEPGHVLEECPTLMNQIENGYA